MRSIDIPRPYALFIGDVDARLDAKTALGLLEWRPDWCIGQVRLPGGIDIGLPDLTAEGARDAGALTLVIGAAPVGGRLAEAWLDPIRSAVRSGLNIAAGLHNRLADAPGLAALATQHNVQLFDVRGAPPGISLSVGTGRRRSGRRVLTVGTDCAIGKKYTALQLERDLRLAGVDATFRATGQTGILISGGGLAIDSIVSDFVAGAVEALSPDNTADHWDVIEGQGSLFHPGYAGVSLSLLHGAQADAFVLCHDPTRTHIDGYPDYPLPTPEDCIGHVIACGKLTNPAITCVGVSLNLSNTPAELRGRVLDQYEARLGVACIDPALTGAGRIVERLKAL